MTSAGSSRRARALVNAQASTRPRPGQFVEQELGDEEPAEHEEDLDAEEAAARPGEIEVIGEHGQHGHAAHAVQAGCVGHARRGPRGAHASGTRPHRHVHDVHPLERRVARVGGGVAPLGRAYHPTRGCTSDREERRGFAQRGADLRRDLALARAVSGDHDVDGAARARHRGPEPDLEVQREARAAEPGSRDRDVDGVVEPDARRASRSPSGRAGRRSPPPASPCTAGRRGPGRRTSHRRTRRGTTS